MSNDAGIPDRILTPASSRRQLRLIVLLGAGVIALITFASYRAILFGWCSSDDFVAMSWLKEVDKNPWLVARNFYSTWLDVPTTQFYRPLWGASLAIDRLLWRDNITGFHITNLILHLSNVALVYAIARELAARAYGVTVSTTEQIKWSLCAALFFAVYPLQSEVVAWITGRVDSIASAFYLGSLWCYMRWRETKGTKWLTASLISFAGALGTKEIAVSLPITLFLYEMILAPAQLLTETQSDTSLLKRIAATKWFWVLLVAYLIVRRITLGTFIGGYDDSLIVTDWSAWKERTARSIALILMPFNHGIIASDNKFAVLWRAFLAIVPIAAILRALTGIGLSRAYLFLVGWFFVTLLPIFRQLALTETLEGSRLGYLASVPVCLFVALALAAPLGNFRTWISDRAMPKYLMRIATRISVVMLAGMIVSASVLIQKNNSAWIEAGYCTQNLQNEFAELLKASAKGELLVFGIPDNINGAVVARNGLGGLTGSPKFDIYDPELDDLVPIGFLRNEEQANLQNANVHRWNASSNKFEKVSNRQSIQSKSQRWEGEQLRTLLNLPSGCIWRADGLELNSPNLCTITISLPDSQCSAVDNLLIHCHDLDSQPAKRLFADLHFSSDTGDNRTITSFATTATRSATGAKSTPLEAVLPFVLKRDVYWLFGKQCKNMSLTFPPSTHLRITSLDAVPSPQVMPYIRIKHTATDSSGLYALFADKPLRLSLNGSNVPGASKCTLQITKQWRAFDKADSESTTYLMKTLPDLPLNGETILDRNLFPVNGNYCIRALAVDTSGNTVGIPGDHLVIMAQ